MKIKNFRAIVFDMDGVFFDTETVVFDVFRMIFRPLNIDLSDEYQYKLVGLPLSRNLDDIRQDFGIEFETDVMRNKFDQTYKEMVTASPLEMQDGIRDLIHKAQQYSLKLALCTTSTRNQVNTIFQSQKNVFDPRLVFYTVVTGDEVTHKKPHPEPYITVSKKLGEAPKDCLVIEDSLSGIQSAKSAGCFCVGLRQPYNQKVNFEEADLVIYRLEQLLKP